MPYKPTNPDHGRTKKAVICAYNLLISGKVAAVKLPADRFKKNSINATKRAYGLTLYVSELQGCFRLSLRPRVTITDIVFAAIVRHIPTKTPFVLTGYVHETVLTIASLYNRLHPGSGVSVAKMPDGSTKIKFKHTNKQKHA